MNPTPNLVEMGAASAAPNVQFIGIVVLAVLLMAMFGLFLFFCNAHYAKCEENTDLMAQLAEEKAERFRLERQLRLKEATVTTQERQLVALANNHDGS